MPEAGLLGPGARHHRFISHTGCAMMHIDPPRRCRARDQSSRPGRTDTAGLTLTACASGKDAVDQSGGRAVSVPHATATRQDDQRRPTASRSAPSPAILLDGGDSPTGRLQGQGRRPQLLGVLVHAVPDREPAVRSALPSGQGPGHPVRRHRRQGQLAQCRSRIRPGQRHQLPHRVGRAGADRARAGQGPARRPAVHRGRRQAAAHRRGLPRRGAARGSPSRDHRLARET